VTDMPQRQFRGWWIPVEIVDLFQEGTINAKETLLLATIDSFVVSGSGCFATNTYLGQCIHASPVSVSHMITKLRRLGLLEHEVVFDEQTGRSVRLLRTCYSSINHLVKNNYPTNGALLKTTRAPSRFLLSPKSTKDPKTPSKTSDNRAKKRSYYTSVLNNTPSTDVDGASGGASHPMDHPSFGINDTCMELAEKLLARLRSVDHDLVHYRRTKKGHVRRPVVSRTIAAELARLLRDERCTESELREIIAWYAANYGRPYVPVLRSVKDLYNRWHSIVMAKQRAEENGEVAVEPWDDDEAEDTSADDWKDKV